MMTSPFATQSSTRSTSSSQERQMQQCRRHEHHSHHIRNPSPSAVPIITPPPSPQLLLEGNDNMYISSDGKAHTYYRLLHHHSTTTTTVSSSSNHNHNNFEYLLQEAYDIENARKEITLLKFQHHQPSYSPQLSNIITFPLQEILNNNNNNNNNNKKLQTNNSNHDRTGSTTWDSSIVMSLYFGRHPLQLVGNVLELGSGVGLGGILTNMIRLFNYNYCYCSGSSSRDDIGYREDDIGYREDEDDEAGHSNVTFTLSEVNQGDIINMLRYNTAVAAEAAIARGLLERCYWDEDELHIERLDWFDFVVGMNHVPDYHHSTAATTVAAATAASTNATTQKRYDTIIASDCIYLSSQIRPLSETIFKLLRPQRQGGGGGGDSHSRHHNHHHEKNLPTAHIFSPYNRGYIQDLIQALREKKDLIVDVETIEMSKFRVKSNARSWSENDNVGNDVSRLDWLLGDDDDDDEDDTSSKDVVSSCCTSKFLHITASFRNDEMKESNEHSNVSMTGID